jgi:hypothetical protein
MILVLLTSMLTLVIVLMPSADAKSAEGPGNITIQLPDFISVSSQAYDISGSDCGITRIKVPNS